MIQVKDTHDKIIKVLEERGPSLPMHISKGMGMSSLFVSAFLSEMVNEKKIKVSHLKVGGSPLYFLEGQEEKLENFSNYLHPRENEAFRLLNEKKVLKDVELEPTVRVALRSIRDFAVGFKKDEEIYWRYILVSEDEAKEILEPKVKIVSVPLFTDINRTKQNRTNEGRTNGGRDSEDVPAIKKSGEGGFKNPLVIKEVRKQKPKSEFVLEVIEFIKQKKFKIVEERDYRTKEYNCVIVIRSELGPMNFLCQAKDKKKISEGDLKKLLSEAQKIPLPAFMIHNGEISKKGKKYVEEYGSVLKVGRIE